MKRLALSTLALAVLLPATGAHAIGLHFEAWPTSATDGCPAPCYQVRMFLEDFTGSQEVRSIQFDIDVQQGAVPATLPVPPNENENAGPGTVAIGDHGRVRLLPWDLSSTVGRSPNIGFDALMVNAASAPVTVGGLRALLANPDTRCFDYPDRCDFFADAVARYLIYLGYFNVTREADAPIGGGYHEGHGINGGFVPQGTPYFRAMVSSPLGSGALPFSGSGPVPFLPEPSLVLLLTGALAMLLTMRQRT